MIELIDREAAIEELKSYMVDPNKAISENPDDVFQYNSGIRTAVGVIMELPTTSLWHRVEEPPKEDGWYILGFLSRWKNGSWWIPDSPDYWMTAGAPQEVQDGK